MKINFRFKSQLDLLFANPSQSYGGFSTFPLQIVKQIAPLGTRTRMPGIKLILAVDTFELVIINIYLVISE